MRLPKARGVFGFVTNRECNGKVVQLLFTKTFGFRFFRWLCFLFAHEITQTDTDTDLYTISRTVPPQNATELHYIDSITRQVHLVPFYKDLYQEEQEQKAPARELFPCGQRLHPNYVAIPMWEVR